MNSERYSGEANEEYRKSDHVRRRQNCRQCGERIEFVVGKRNGRHDDSLAPEGHRARTLYLCRRLRNAADRALNFLRRPMSVVTTAAPHSNANTALAAK